MAIELPIPAGWHAVRLSELGEVNRGRSRHRPRHDPLLYGGQYPFIQTGDIKDSGGRITTFRQTYNEQGLAQSRLWPAGTMCITIAANIAETAILGFPACFPDSVIGFVANEAECDVRFIEYLFRQLRRYIQHEASDSGTVQDNINLEYLEHLRFPVPELSLQKRIASTLSPLDEKIELNRRMSRTLGGLAAAMFARWIEENDAHVRARKTQELIDSGILYVNDGYRAKNSEMGSLGLPFARAGNVDDGFLFEDADILASSGVTAAGEKVARDYDCVFTSKGSVGRVAVVLPSTPRFVYSPQLCFWRSLDPSRLHPLVLLEWMRSPAFREQVDAVKGQTDMADYVNLRDQRVMSLCLPWSTSQSALVERLSPLLALVEVNVTMNQSLSDLRDCLLGPLLSGELTIREAEKAVAAVT